VHFKALFYQRRDRGELLSVQNNEKIQVLHLFLSSIVSSKDDNLSVFGLGEKVKP